MLSAVLIQLILAAPLAVFPQHVWSQLGPGNNCAYDVPGECIQETQRISVPGLLEKTVTLGDGIVYYIKSDGGRVYVCQNSSCSSDCAELPFTFVNTINASEGFEVGDSVVFFFVVNDSSGSGPTLAYYAARYYPHSGALDCRFLAPAPGAFMTVVHRPGVSACFDIWGFAAPWSTQSEITRVDISGHSVESLGAVDGHLSTCFSTVSPSLCVAWQPGERNDSDSLIIYGLPTLNLIDTLHFEDIQGNVILLEDALFVPASDVLWEIPVGSAHRARVVVSLSGRLASNIVLRDANVYYLAQIGDDTCLVSDDGRNRVTWPLGKTSGRRTLFLTETLAGVLDRDSLLFVDLSTGQESLRVSMPYTTMFDEITRSILVHDSVICAVAEDRILILSCH